MEKKLIVLLILVLTGCSPKFNKNVEVKNYGNNYRFFIDYYDQNKDSIEIDWMLSYRIKNLTKRGIKLHRIRKRPYYSYQSRLMVVNDSVTLFDDFLGGSIKQ